MNKNNPQSELLGLNLIELTALLEELNLPKFRAKQIFDWLQNKAVLDYSLMANLPLEMRNTLATQLPLNVPRIIQRQEADGGNTIKLLLELADGAQIETVLMLYSRANNRDRATCCVSTQSGCAMGCTFCATGQFNEARNLTAAEIVVQVLLCSQIAKERGFPGVTNLVYMGMGEPLLNLPAVKKSILLLNESQGQNIGQRRMVVSTCGLVPQIRELADWQQQISLAVSLHSADETVRRQLMPIAGRYSLAELLDACYYFRQQTGRRVTFEYALFAGVNDTPADAAAVAALLKGSDILVNIIPANPVPQAGFWPSKREIIEEFAAILEKHGCEIAVREARGLEIDAACGQLRGAQQLKT